MHPHRQLGLGGVQGGRGVAADARVAAQGLGADTRPVHADLGPHEPLNGPALVRGDGDVQHHPVLPGNEVSLPTRGDPGVAPAHQETVSGVLQGGGVVAFRSVVEEHQGALAAPVGRLVKHPAVALAAVLRPQKVDVATVVHGAALVPGRIGKIDDAGVAGIVRLHLPICLARHDLVRTGGPELVAIGERLPATCDKTGQHERDLR